MTHTPDENRPFVTLPNVTHDIALALSADWHDTLLDYLLIWGEAGDYLRLVNILNETPGPAMHMLDLEAYGLFREGEYDAALDIMDKRLKRSPSIAASAFEASVQQAAGYREHALASAEKLLKDFDNTSVLIKTSLVARYGK